jgi:hypothetical protein
MELKSLSHPGSAGNSRVFRTLQSAAVIPVPFKFTENNVIVIIYPKDPQVKKKSRKQLSLRDLMTLSNIML